MVTVETIGRIRRAFLVDHKPIRQIVRELRVSRKTVRKAIRGSSTEFGYERQSQPQPRLGEYVARLDGLLEANSKRPARERLTARRLFELLRAEGYQGAYDSVQRHVRAWRRARSQQGAVFIPLWFAPGEAYQFDWSHEVVVLGGVTTMIKVAHIRLCHSRMFLVRAYPRETQEMVFAAHDHAFRLFGGGCHRGIYDNMTTAVDAVFLGKERRFNRRFLRMCSHYLVDPVACTPASGWEKGQVENQVGNIREHFFTPRLHFASYAELNAWLEARCLSQARESAHPEHSDKTVWEVFEAERPSLISYPGSFDGFHEVEVAVSKSSLVRFDHNRYSVAAKAARRTAQLRAYADRIVVWCDGEIVGETCSPLRPRPDRLRSLALSAGAGQEARRAAQQPAPAQAGGDPFRNWDLPPALAQIRRRLAGHDDGDRQFVDILTEVAEAGLDAVEAACGEALSARLFGRDVVLNILAGQRDVDPPRPVATPTALALAIEPMAIAPATISCAVRCRPRRSTRYLERHEIIELMGQLKLAGMRAAYDEVITAGLRAQHSVQRIIGELLLAQLADNRHASLHKAIVAGSGLSIVRYTHRVAIANSRLVTFAGGRVSFRWRDYRHHTKSKIMTLAADEFIRRFLLHALPDGFHHIRHYGFLANRRRAEKLALCRTLLAVADAAAPLGDSQERQRLADRAADVCPGCGGHMEPIGPFPRSLPTHSSAWHDSS